MHIYMYILFTHSCLNILLTAAVFVVATSSYRFVKKHDVFFNWVLYIAATLTYH